MATAKKRINISVSKALEEALDRLSKRDEVPVASKATELLRLAVEMEEDRVWDEIASERIKRDKVRVSQKNAWR